MILTKQTAHELQVVRRLKEIRRLMKENGGKK